MTGAEDWQIALVKDFQIVRAMLDVVTKAYRYQVASRLLYSVGVFRRSKILLWHRGSWILV